MYHADRENRARETYLEQGIVYEDVLILCLDHVVPLGPQTSHVTIHVHLG